jgi:hypothetical protein
MLHNISVFLFVPVELTDARFSYRQRHSCALNRVVNFKCNNCFYE